MRILLVNRYYGGQQVPTGRMLRDVGEELARRGHEVVVLTSADSYTATAGDAAGGPHGVTVRRLWTGGTRRWLSWPLFWLQACLRVPLARWDRCVVLTDPPFLPVASGLARLLGGRRRFYWWTMDLYPEALVAHGMLPAGGWRQRALAFLNEVGLRWTDGVVCLGRRQRQRLAGYAHFRDSDSFCTVVPPWDHRPLPRVERGRNRFLAKYGWRHKRVALYAGNLGQAHGFGELLEAARELHRRGDAAWVFAFVVRGAGKRALEAAAAGLGNVAVLDYQDPDWTADLLWAADVHLVTLTEGWEGVVVPSKLYGILQTDAPVLFIGPADADTADEIQAYGAGRTLPPRCGAADVVAALEELYGRPRRASAPRTDGPARVATFVAGPDPVPARPAGRKANQAPRPGVPV